MVRWIQHNNRKADSRTLILKNRTCLELASLPAPWSVNTDPAVAELGNGIIIVADGQKAGLRPYMPSEQAGAKTDIWGYPLDGKLRIIVSGWSPPSPAWASYIVASPARINENIQNGDFKPLDLWPGKALGLEAYQGFGGRSYVDKRRLIQCRDYTRGNEQSLVWCTAVNSHTDFQIGFRFDSRDVTKLPEVLQRIERSIEATRKACPKRPTLSAGKREPQHS